MWAVISPEVSIPPGSGDRKGSFDDLMSSMGVRRMDDDGARARGRKAPTAKPRKKRATTSLPAETPSIAGVAPPRPAAPPARTPASPQLVSSAAVVPKPDARAAELAALRDELVALTATAAEAAALVKERDRLTAALADRDQALERAHTQLRALTRSLARAGGDPGGDPLPAAAILQARGVLGPTELDSMLRAFADARMGADLLRQLAVPDPQALTALLDDRLVLLGGCERCPPAPGRVVLTVPRARCEVCRGQDLGAAQRHFFDACLVNGLTRIVLVGGQPKDHRLLRTLLHDRRLQLILVPGGLGRGAEQIAEDLADTQVVVLWEGHAVETGVVAAYQAFDGPVLTVQADAVGPLLEAMGRLLPTTVRD